MAIGIYIHVPFCASRCDFCAFYRESPDRRQIRRYLQALEAEWRLRHGGEPIETIFFGGGTPGLLAAEDFAAIADFLAPDPKHLREWTVEFSPATVKEDKLLVLKKLGVTRISLGVQSFDEKCLANLGRRDGPRKALTAIDLIQQCGLDLNLDLIFHGPRQTLRQWQADLERAIALSPNSISTYCLSYEDHTPLADRRPARENFGGEFFYRWTWKTLKSAGYEHYEVSNFAKNGKRCLHNCRVWQMENWLGIGPSAASQYGGRRFQNVANLEHWICGIDKGHPLEENSMHLTDGLIGEDYMIFGLRTASGVSRDRLKKLMGQRWTCYEHLFQDLVTAKLMRFESDYFRLTDRGLLVVDAIGQQIFEMGQENSAIRA